MVKKEEPLSCKPNSNGAVRRLLVLDMAYALEAIRSRGLENSVTCRDLGGFFEHVWTVHPVATLVASGELSSQYGVPEVNNFLPRHTFIEGKVGLFSSLGFMRAINFILSQIYLFFYLTRIIRKKKISAIRCGDPHFLGLFGWALSRLSGIPFCIRVAANYDKIYETTGKSGSKLFFGRKIEKIVERFILKRAHLVVAGNQNNLNFALANGARSEFSTLFRYGNLIDKRHFGDLKDRPDGSDLLQELGVESNRFLLYVGRLDSVKHPDDVVRVLAKVRGGGEDIKAVLVGDGPLLEKLSAQARELGVEDHVIFCGNKDQSWLISVIPLAAVVLSPHTGRALLEVALGEVPIVAYDLDWQSELIETGVTGELVPHCESESMADAVNRFLTDPEYARAMGVAVRKRAVEMMDPEMLNQHEKNTYLELLKNFKKNTID